MPEAVKIVPGILADFAADQPQVLVDLLLDADDKQFATLYPKLTAHAEDGARRLLDVLDGQPQSQWIDPPLNGSWTQPDAALVRKVEAGGGVVAERFVFCQTLPLRDFPAVAEGLRPSGYRPIRLRPYAVGEVVQAAAVWTRDGQEWHLAHSLSAEAMRQRDA